MVCVSGSSVQVACVFLTDLFSINCARSQIFSQQVSVVCCQTYLFGCGKLPLTVQCAEHHACFLFAESALGSKRGRGPDAVGDLQQHSKQLRMLGQDPLPATLHQAQLAGLHQGQFSQVPF